MQRGGGHGGAVRPNSAARGTPSCVHTQKNLIVPPARKYRASLGVAGWPVSAAQKNRAEMDSFETLLFEPRGPKTHRAFPAVSSHETSTHALLYRYWFKIRNKTMTQGCCVLRELCNIHVVFLCLFVFIDDG